MRLPKDLLRVMSFFACWRSSCPPPPPLEHNMFFLEQEHGFILNIDTKWRTHPDVSSVPKEEWLGHPSVTELYCLGICHQRGIRTLRDLRARHLPMLQEMYR